MRSRHSQHHRYRILGWGDVNHVILMANQSTSAKQHYRQSAPPPSTPFRRVVSAYHCSITRGRGGTVEDRYPPPGSEAVPLAVILKCFPASVPSEGAEFPVLARQASLLTAKKHSCSRDR